MQNLLKVRPYFLLVLGGTLFSLIFALPVEADIGPRWWGNYGSDPQGGVKGIAITRQTLTIDLRPLMVPEPVHVEAIYYLNNPGPAKNLALLFVAGSKEVRDFEARLAD